MPKAFSYLRFSTPDQMKGDSLRRQTEAARSYADRNGLELDEELTFRDLGVSAFRGANAEVGRLADFLTAVKAGIVPANSYLLIESLDRISRITARKAARVLEDIVDRGVTVVTLNDGKIYTQETLDDDPMSFVMAVVIFIRAHEESETKSRRLLAAWRNKRARASSGGHKMTSRAPAWLRLRDGRFEVIETRAALVRRIFAMALAGHGKAGIAKALNAEGIAPFGDGATEARKADGWHVSYIHKILNNEAVIGRYQPMRRVWGDDVDKTKRRVKRREPEGAPIEGYFPVILSDPADFYRLRRGGGLSGHGTSEPVNALSGIARCSVCGAAMHYVNKGAGPKGGAYLACDGARRKRTCDAKSVRYAVVLDAVIAAMEDGEIDLRTLASGDELDRKRELAAAIEATDGKIKAAETAIGNLLDVLSRLPSSAIETRLAEQEAALLQLRAEKQRLEGAAREITAEGDPVRDVMLVLAEMRAGGSDTVLRLNAALKRIVERVEVGPGDEAREWLERGVVWADKLTSGRALPSPMMRKLFAEVMAADTASIALIFRTPGRHLVICANRRRPGWFAAGAAREIGGAIADYTLKVYAVPPAAKLIQREGFSIPGEHRSRPSVGEDGAVEDCCAEHL